MLRTWVWIAFAGWIIWWLLVLFRIADATSAWMVYSAFGFLLPAVVAGPVVAGLLLGLGLSAVFTGSGGLEPSLVWVGFGVLGSAGAIITFVLRRESHPSVSVQEGLKKARV